MRIYNNMSAIKATNNLSKVNKNKTSNLEKLSSGLRINKASDDAAGLAISENMRAQIRGMKQAVRNASDGQALLQTAESGMGEIGDILHRMRELAIQGSSETYDQPERDKIVTELKELGKEVNRIAATTKFNGKSILNGAATVKLQVGANNDANEQLEVGLLDASAIGAALVGTDGDDGAVKAITDATDLDDVTKAFTDLITEIDNQMSALSTSRAQLGSNINRLDFTINNLNSSIENLTDAESRIRDLDIASETVEFTRNNILSQSGTAMLAQANAMPQSILQIL